MTGSGNVFFGGKPVARVTDLVKCDLVKTSTANC
ncbi:PAAR domain-containing protein [Paraburkholderia sp. J69-1]